MDEVARVSIDQPKGRIIAQPKLGKVIDLQALNDAITGAGFTPREIEVEVTGRIENWNGRATLVVNEIERYFLEPPDKVKQIEQALGAGKKLVMLTGSATHPDAHRAHPYTIAIKTFQIR